MLIRDTLRRDLSRKIEEIVKVDQTDEVVVHEELSEYVVTPSIRDYYQRVLTAIAEAPKTLSEGVGVWVSGFFGSGNNTIPTQFPHISVMKQVKIAESDSGGDHPRQVGNNPKGLVPGGPLEHQVMGAIVNNYKKSVLDYCTDYPCC